MIIQAIANIIISVIGAILTPVGFVNNIFGNILANSKLTALIRLSCFFFSSELLTFAIDTLIMWFSFFLLRPLVNFIRNKS